MSQRIPSLFIAPSTIHHRGVYTAEAIDAGNVIEICPVIVLSPQDRKLIHKSKLHDYYFTWGEKDDGCAIALGFGSIYNHSYQPNARFWVDLEMETISVHTIQAIEAGGEILFNYNGDPKNMDELWFTKK